MNQLTRRTPSKPPKLLRSMRSAVSRGTRTSHPVFCFGAGLGGGGSIARKVKGEEKVKKGVTRNKSDRRVQVTLSANRVAVRSQSELTALPNRVHATKGIF